MVCFSVPSCGDRGGGETVLPPGLGDQLHEPHVSVRKDPVP